MAKTKTSSAVKDRYNAKAYDEVKVRVPKGRKQAIQDIAQSHDESLNGFIITAIDERMARLGSPQTCKSKEDDKVVGSGWLKLTAQEMHRRQAAGIEEAKNEGKYSGENHKGRARVTIDTALFNTLYADYCAGKITVADMAPQLGLSEHQLYRRIRERKRIGEGYDPNAIQE